VSEGTINVLLVEDNEVDVEGVQRAFKRYKIRNPIIVARDGIEALDMLRGNGESVPIQRPYMVILDLNLPRMDGIEFLQELRRDPGLKDSIVFVLTTSQDRDDKLASYDLNVAGYMVKSRIGEGFLGLCEMLDCYWRVIELPPARR
jgi:CheY-like chemotaxis protein